MTRRLLVLTLLLLGTSGCDKKRDRAALDIRNLTSSTEAFTKAVGRPPQNLAEMSAPLCEGAGCVLPGIAYDPWGTQYRGKLIGERVRVISAGPDKAWDTEDDVGATVSDGK